MACEESFGLMRLGFKHYQCKRLMLTTLTGAIEPNLQRYSMREHTLTHTAAGNHWGVSSIELTTYLLSM